VDVDVGEVVAVDGVKAAVLLVDASSVVVVAGMVDVAGDGFVPPVHVVATAEEWLLIGVVGWSDQATTFMSVPMPPIEIETTSPCSSVNSGGGTTPAPVIRKQPCGNDVSRVR